MGSVSETCEKYEVATGPSPVEHFQLYIRLNLDELGFERSLAPKRGIVLGKSCAGYQGKDSDPDLLAHLPSLQLGLAILPQRHLLVFISRESFNCC